MKNIFLIFLIFLSSQFFSQKIRIKVLNQKDTTVHLIRYYGEKLYYADTAEMKNGMVVFDGAKQKPGIVGLFLPGQKYFEFIYNNEDIILETSSPDFLANMKVKKSVENMLFIPYINFIQSQRIEMSALTEKRNALAKENPENKILSDKIDKMNKDVDAYQLKLIEENPTKLVGKIVKMSRDVTIPEVPRDANGLILDSNFRFKFYRTHFWDNVDLNEDALVNNPVFHNKLEFYFGKNMLVQHWDSVLYYAFDFCDRLKQDSKIFEYSVGWIASTFGKSEIMGMDKVYLYMLNRYYCTKNSEGKSPAFWVAEDKFKDMCENLPNKLNLVVGVRPPNLILKDTSDTKWIDFYSLKSDFTIVYFWDPECGHCKKTTPKLAILYEKKFKLRNVEIYAIGKALGKDFEGWKKFIRENNMSFINVAVTDKLYELAKTDPNSLVPVYPGEKGKPTTLESLNYQTTYDIFSMPKVYILDKDKKIIAKHVSISQMEEIIDRLQGFSDAPKLFPPDLEEDEHMQKKE